MAFINNIIDYFSPEKKVKCISEVQEQSKQLSEHEESTMKIVKEHCKDEFGALKSAINKREEAFQRLSDRVPNLKSIKHNS